MGVGAGPYDVLTAIVRGAGVRVERGRLGLFRGVSPGPPWPPLDPPKDCDCDCDWE